MGGVCGCGQERASPTLRTRRTGMASLWGPRRLTSLARPKGYTCVLFYMYMYMVCVTNQIEICVEAQVHS